MLSRLFIFVFYIYLDGEIHGVRGRALLLAVVVLFELRLVVHADAQVVEHALHLPRELRAAALLQLRDHELLVLVAGRPLVEQALGQLVPVDLREEVLVDEVREELHGLLQVRLDILVAELHAARLQDAVAEARPGERREKEREKKKKKKKKEEEEEEEADNRVSSVVKDCLFFYYGKE